MKGEAIADSARSWIGTPYKHQASTQGVGADCLGLVRGVYRECVGAEPEVPPAYSWDWGESCGEEILFAAATRNLREVPFDDARAGSVLLFRMRAGSVAKHLGILTAGPPNQAFVHAYSRHGVVESSLSLPWRRKVVAAFEFPQRTG